MNSERILQQVQASLRPQAKAFLQEKQQTPELSLLLRALLFVGALCGAVLLISASSLHIFFTHFWPRGVIFLVAGWILLHRWRDDGSGRGLFLRQLGGLLALGGQILIGLELESWLRYKYLWLGITVLAGVSYPLFRSSFNRFFWCALAVSLCCYKLIDGGDLGVTACGLIGLGLFAAAAGIFIKRRPHLGGCRQADDNTKDHQHIGRVKIHWKIHMNSSFESPLSGTLPSII